MRMKRTNLVLNEELLEETLFSSKKRTYSEAVNEAMQEYVRTRKFREIFKLEKSGAWEGNLDKMRSR
jgi:Arc/MetJ family transcription regulator